MESTLRKTLIKLDKGPQLHFYKITKFNRFGCKAIFYDPTPSSSNPPSPSLYDVTVLSKSLLQLNSLTQLLEQNLRFYQNINSKVVCPITCITYDGGDIMYIISKAERYRLSELVDKREGLTEFEVVYFLGELMEVLGYLRSRGLFYQIIDIDEIYLTKSMKLVIPFSIWVSSVTNIKSMALRHEDKKSFIAPQLLKSGQPISAEDVNSWNIGVFVYELIEGVKPFTRSGGELGYTRDPTVEICQLLGKLLKRSVEERLRFPLILLQGVFKKYPSLPHILPNTIFSCPPSNQYISEYCSTFHQNEKQKIPPNNKILNIQTAKILPICPQPQLPQNQLQLEPQSPIICHFPKPFKSSKYIKPSDRSLTQTKSYITEFADISDSFGYGYQMSAGLICFVFNDGSQMYFENSAKKVVSYVTEKKVVHRYVYEKISQESEIKKKLFILQAYTKSIKKYKHPVPPASNPNPQKPTTVAQYYRTNSASIFLLSNQTIQIIFNDRINFLLTKHTIHVQNKSSEKWETYEGMQVEGGDLGVRKRYGVCMAEMLFHWDGGELGRIRAKGEGNGNQKGNGNGNVNSNVIGNGIGLVKGQNFNRDSFDEF